jgi:hypothetical protein
MPRASWRGFLRLSLVSCPIYIVGRWRRPGHPCGSVRFWHTGSADRSASARPCPLATAFDFRRPRARGPARALTEGKCWRPRGTGMALFTLRAAGEVRAPQFGSAEGDLDTEMVAIAGAIIRQRTGNFDPSTVPGQLLRRHRPRRVPERIQRRPRQVAPQGAVRGTRNLLADTLNIEAQTGMGRTGTMFHTIQRSSDRKSGSPHQRGQGHNQLPQRGAGVCDLAGDLRPLLDKPGESVRPINRHAALLFQ